MNSKKHKKGADTSHQKKSKKLKLNEPPANIENERHVQKPKKRKQTKVKNKKPVVPVEPTSDVDLDHSENEASDALNVEPKVDQKDDSEPGKSSEIELINWPEKDLSELFRRMETSLPETDTLAYSTRVEKLNWDDIAFNKHSGEDCKKTWMLVQKRVRRFRILGEVLADAKEWISKPWTNFYRGSKMKRHPEMPRRPLSSYMLFYLKKKDKILAENPGIEMTDVSKKIAEMFKNLSPEKREKYVKMALEKRKEYEEKVQEFYQKYPDLQKISEKASHHKPAEVGPKKPSTPFGIYYREQLKSLGNVEDTHAIKEKLKEQWRNMSDKKKVVWIDWSLDEEAKYKEELKRYISQNPDYVSPPVKAVLTKEERLIKERVAGKPIKPPNSAYSLFSRMMLQSEDIKSINSKDRMNVISNQWKNCSEDEKKRYKERAKHMMEQYKLDFASYLESLPEEKRAEELKNNIPKRKTKAMKEETPKKNAKKKKPAEPAANASSKPAFFAEEPKRPPSSAYLLFCLEHPGQQDPKSSWKSLSSEERKKYESKLEKQKRIYMSEFEKFLKSLTKKQLTEFKQARQASESETSKNEEEEDDEDDEDSEESSSASSDSDSESSSS